MMTDKTEKNQTGAPSKAKEADGLEEFFSTDRAGGPVVDSPLMDAILRDAAMVQNSFRKAPAPTTRRPGRFMRIADVLGGWGGLSALSICAATGLIVGFSTPATVADYSFGVVAGTVTQNLEFDTYLGLDEFMTENG